MIKVLFFISLFLIIYTYIGYPVLLIGLKRVKRKKVNKADIFPSVTLLVVAYNEEKVIKRKIENSLTLNYPKDKFDIVIASDGSEDKTEEIVREYEDEKKLILKTFSPRMGKNVTLNRVIEEIESEIIVFSDADTICHPESIRKLIRNFADPEVGAVSANVKLEEKGAVFKESEGIYYRYERFIQEAESSISSMICVDGGMFAIRRKLYFHIPPGVACDDVIPTRIAQLGYRVIYEPEALAIEESAPSWIEEFRRRVRMSAFGINNLLRVKILPTPFQSWLFLQYISHRILRLISPFLFILLLITNILVFSQNAFYGIIFILQLCFYLCIFLSIIVSRMKLPIPFHFPFYFFIANTAFAVGVLKGLFRKQSGICHKTSRKGNDLECV